MLTRGVHRTHRLLAAIAIVARHILGYLFGLLRLDRLVHFGHGRSRAGQPTRVTGPEHVRLAVEELGVASIKIGQILSTRTDLLTPAYQVELAKLQDSAPPEPTAIIRDVLATELGSPIETVFAVFDPQPMAAASIGQVHAATLPDGSEVIVKIRRPGVVEQIELDLQILEATVRPISRLSRAARRYDLAGLVDEFATTLRSELDYQREASNVERFAANFAGDASVHIPRVYRERSTRRVLTLERLRGLKVDDIAGLDRAGIDRPALAQHAATVTLRMIFEHGFFHADPHPGNFFIETDGRIGLIDFGMVGTVDPATRAALRAVLVALVERDTAPLVDAFVALGMTTTPLDPNQLAPDIDNLISRHLSLPLAEIRLGILLRDLFAIIRRHRLRLPPNLAALAKTLAMSEGIAAQLDPSFEMTTAIAIYLPHLLHADPAPGAPVSEAAANAVGGGDQPRPPTSPPSAPPPTRPQPTSPESPGPAPAGDIS